MSAAPGRAIRPFLDWDSPLTAARVAAGAIRLSGVSIDGADVYWLEGRPGEGGRSVLVRRRAGGTSEVLPADVSVRTRVHEYGGGAYAVAAGVVYFVNDADQRVYRCADAGSTAPLTPAPPSDRAWRYADFAIDARRARLICVREDHTAGGEPQNALVRIPLAGPPSAAEIIASGHDFYASPRLSADGERLAWLCWRHPYMPWEAAELWIARVDSNGELTDARRLAGGIGESVYQPGWAADGRLYAVVDRGGRWRLHRWDRPHDDSSDPVAVVADPPADAEFGRPQWVFGSATWAWAGSDRIVASYTRRGVWRLAAIDLASGELSAPLAALEPHEWLAASGDDVVLTAGFPDRPDAVVRLDLRSGAVETLMAVSDVDLDPAFVSVAESIEFPTEGGRTAHAFFYAPRHGTLRAPHGERPPLVVMSHGGPTAAASSSFDLDVQFWTTHGFAVVDVNYGGSSGFGRAYRERLDGQWGIVDVDDCVHAATWLATQGRVDGARLVIRGGSAGGYTTLCALTFRPGIFAAGASYYGISDLEALATDSHKFEAHSLDVLVGPYPAARELYRARSPIHFVDRLSCPLILFQGAEDKVVPPGQAQAMADAVRTKGLPVVHLVFDGEQHGFRRSETIARCLEEELAFFRAVLAS